MFSKLFTKKTKEVTKSNIEKLNNIELKNVIGGLAAEPVILTPEEQQIIKSKSNVKNN